MSFEIFITAGRQADFSGTLKDAAGTAISITAGSKVRFKIFRRGGTTPVLDIGPTATANGSITTFTAGSGAGAGGYTVKIAKDDSTSLGGPYDVELSLIDAGDSNVIKHAEFGVLQVAESPLGTLT